MEKVFGKRLKRLKRLQKGNKTMANVISDDTIEYVGILAKLELSPEEKEEAKK